MPTTWTQQELQRHIDEGIEESLNLDYKAADALAKTDGKKTEITKDVSAMANSAGGVIIYGIKEHSDPAKKHLPETPDGIDRAQFSKEWLEQVINNIQPRVNGIIIHPVELNAPSNQVAYVVEIPQSTTAHQAKDFRYYKRFNFESVPMSDYEIRDVMNRRIFPDIEVKFDGETTYIGSRPCYLLKVLLRNVSDIPVEKYKLEFTFPIYSVEKTRSGSGKNYKNSSGLFDVLAENESYKYIFRSNATLFPKDEIDLGSSASISFYMDDFEKRKLRDDRLTGEERMLNWALYADNMPPKKGEVSLTTLIDY